MVDFLPSHVHLDAGSPLGACFKKTEREHAAALLVWCCQKMQDNWQTVTFQDVSRLLFQAAHEEPVASWMRNPMFNPDFENLAKMGAITTEPGTDGAQEVKFARLTFTERGLEALRRWARIPSDPA